MEFVGLGPLPSAFADRVSWSKQEIDLYFKLLCTKKYDLQYIADALGRPFMEVQAMTQKLDHEAQQTEPVDQLDVPFAYEVPENFDSVFLPSQDLVVDYPKDVVLDHTELDIFNVAGCAAIRRWARLCGVTWTQELVKVLTQHMLSFALEIVREVAESRFMEVIDGERVITGPAISALGVIKPPSDEGTALDVELRDTIAKSVLDKTDPNWVKLHIQKTMLDIGRLSSLGDVTCSCPSQPLSVPEQRALKRVKRQDRALEEHDNAKTVDFIRATAAAKGNQPSTLDHITEGV